MKILQINKFFYIKGGSERCLINTADVLRNQGHEVAFFSMHHPGNIDTEWSKYFVSNIDFNKHLGVQKKISIFFNTLYSRAAKNKIEELISDFKPDVAHIHNFNHQLTPSILTALYKKRIPIVITLHDYKLICPSYSMLDHGKICELCEGKRFYHCVRTKCHKNSFSKSLLATLESYLHHNVLGSYKKISSMISPSIFLINKCKEMGLHGNYYYLPNFVDIKKMQPQFNKDSINIVYCGKLSEEKGIKTLLKAMKGLSIHLNVLGDGQLKSELIAAISKNGINNINVLGYLNSKELFSNMRESLFSVLPSEWYENNPYAILESFALGMPVIGARIGGIPELVKDGITGLTFEPGNADDLRNKMEYMLANREKVVEMGRNARKLVEEEYNAEKHYTNLMLIYNKAIKKNKEK